MIGTDLNVEFHTPLSFDEETHHKNSIAKSKLSAATATSLVPEYAVRKPNGDVTPGMAQCQNWYVLA